MNAKTNLAIFDLDGTLFDTKAVNYHAYLEALKQEGIRCDVTYAFYCSYCNGRYYRDFLPVIAPGISEESMERVHRRKGGLYVQYLHLARKNDHLFRMIGLMRPEYQIALVTTASKGNVEAILRRYDAVEWFDFVITQEDVSAKKPDPECFLKAMERAGANADHTIIFEDSETGLEAAERSGASVLKVFGYC